MIAFIDQMKDRFGVELLCRVLRPAVSGFLSARGFRAAKARMPSARQLREELLVPEVARLHAENYGVYGRRKMHALMRRQSSYRHSYNDCIVPGQHQVHNKNLNEGGQLRQRDQFHWYP